MHVLVVIISTMFLIINIIPPFQKRTLALELFGIPFHHKSDDWLLTCSMLTATPEEKMYRIREAVRVCVLRH